MRQSRTRAKKISLPAAPHCLAPRFVLIRALTCNRLRVRLQMPTEGPCRVDGCTDPDNSSGQWQYIPEKYCLEHDNLEYRKSCVCKKPACHRRCGLKPEKQIPGRKRKADDFSLGVALEEQRDLPRPPIIASIMHSVIRHASSIIMALIQVGCVVIYGLCGWIYLSLYLDLYLDLGAISANYANDFLHNTHITQCV